MNVSFARPIKGGFSVIGMHHEEYFVSGDTHPAKSKHGTDIIVLPVANLRIKSILDRTDQVMGLFQDKIEALISEFTKGLEYTTDIAGMVPSPDNVREVVAWMYAGANLPEMIHGRLMPLIQRHANFNACLEREMKTLLKKDMEAAGFIPTEEKPKANIKSTA